MTTSSNNNTDDENDIGIDFDTECKDVAWELDYRNCTLPVHEGNEYCQGESWYDGRVELKFNGSLVDQNSRTMARTAILQAYYAMHQSICDEGLFHRPYSQMVDSSVVTTECLGEDGGLACGRIGSVVSIKGEYAVYGRIDNVQLLVKNPNLFPQMMVELVDTKTSMLRHATVDLERLSRKRDENLANLQVKYQKNLRSFAYNNQDALVSMVCERQTPATLQDQLVRWESERQNVCSRWKTEYETTTMEVEHDFCQQRRDVILRRQV